MSETVVRELFGVPVHALGYEQVLAEVARAIRTRQSLLIGVVNAAKLVNMYRDPGLGRAVLSADLILADGMSVVWACRLLRRPVPERIAGIDLMESMLAQAARCGHRIFCLGATQEVLTAAVTEMRARYPGLAIAGQHHGYFRREEEPALAALIRDARPDILLAAMTSPKKEEFLARWSRRLGVPVCHGVGGAFDVLAGKIRRAPSAWQRAGLEWLFRVVQEPRRMWRRYLVTNTLFCGLVVSELLGGGRLIRHERTERTAA